MIKDVVDLSLRNMSFDNVAELSKEDFSEVLSTVLEEVLNSGDFKSKVYSAAEEVIRTKIK